MVARRALRMIREMAAAKMVLVTDHVLKRMKERNVSAADLDHALRFVAHGFLQYHGTWKVTGPDSDGNDLTLALTIENGLIIVTLFKDKDDEEEEGY